MYDTRISGLSSCISNPYNTTDGKLLVWHRSANTVAGGSLHQRMKDEAPIGQR